MGRKDIPDFSCEIDKPLSYLEYIFTHFTDIKNRNEHCGLLLDAATVDTFGWMLAESRGTALDMQKWLYPK